MRRMILAGLAFVLLSGLLPSVSVSYGAQTTTVTLTPTEDSYIDSANNGTWYGSQTRMYVEYYQNATNPADWRKMQGWLKFSLVSIPPQATVQTATLTVYRYDTGSAMNLTACRAVDNSWSEATLTYNNAPHTSVPADSTYTSRVTMTAGSARTYTLDILQDVRNALTASGVLTEVLRVYPALPSDSSARISSRESGAQTPTLTVTYSYVSVSVSLSAASATFGQAVTAWARTDPAQTTGSLKLQYSTDNATWADVASTTGGNYNFSWTPPSGGTFYLRSVWSTSWSTAAGPGSYSATSSASLLTVGKAASYITLFMSTTSVPPGQPVTLTALLSPALSTGTVAFQYSMTGTTYLQITSGAPVGGTFAYTWTPPSTGTYYVRATWGGDASYNASTSPSQTLTVSLLPTTMSFAAPSSAKIGEALALTATLRGQERNPLAGASVTFSLNTTVLGTATTGSTGVASFTHTLTVPAGTYVLKASYAGSATQQAAEESITIVVNPLRLVLTSSFPDVLLFRFDGRDYASDASGKVAIRVNSTGTYALSVNSPILLAPGTRAIFKGWGDGSATMLRTVIMDVDQTFSALMETEYHLATSSAYAFPVGEGWYKANSSAAFSIDPIVDHGNETRRVFTGWTGDIEMNETSGSIVMNSAKAVVATWKKQFHVAVYSPHGTGAGDGWYDVGATAVVSVTPGTVETGNGTRYLLAAWTGDLNTTDLVASIVVDAPKNVSASWSTEHFLDLKSAHGTPKGRGWHTEGSYVNVSVESSLPADDWSASLGGELVFDGWTGDVTSSQASVTVLMDGPKTLTARWRAEYTTPLLIIGAAAVVLIVVVALALRPRKPPAKPPA